MKIKLLHCYIAKLLNGCIWHSRKNQSCNLTIQQSNNSTARLSAGFTLIELIIYMALLGIFLLTLTDIFTSILDVQLESEATSAVEMDSRFLLARLSYDINRASAITTPSAIGESANSLTLVIGGINYTYLANGNSLELTNNSGTSSLNGSETAISGLTFQKIANSSVSGTKETVKINFTATSIAQRTQGPEVRNFQTTVGRR